MGRTLADFSSSLETALFAEEIAGRPGLLQRLDPRAKVATTLGLLLTVSLLQHVPTLMALYLLSLGLAVAAQVPLGFFVKRVWLFLPFFTGIVAVPALIVTPGRPLVTLLQLGSISLGPLALPQEIAITEQGLRTATLLVLRVGTSLSFAMLLVLTTPWAHLLKALRVLHVPRAFVVILGMTHRYIFLLLHLTNSMFLARRSRTVGRLSGPDNRRWLTGTAGTLLSKSYYLSHEVYLAMLSRGYRGEAVTWESFRMQRRDWLWSGFVAACGAAALFVDRLW